MKTTETLCFKIDYGEGVRKQELFGKNWIKKLEKVSVEPGEVYALGECSEKNSKSNKQI